MAYRLTYRLPEVYFRGFNLSAPLKQDADGNKLHVYPISEGSISRPH